MAGFVGPEIGEFVLFRADMTAYPNELNGVGLIKLKKFLHDVEIFNFATFLFPAVAGPARCPLSKDIDPELRVAMDFARASVGILDSGDHSFAFHADVGGFGFAAFMAFSC